MFSGIFTLALDHFSDCMIEQKHGKALKKSCKPRVQVALLSQSRTKGT